MKTKLNTDDDSLYNVRRLRAQICELERENAELRNHEYVKELAEVRNNLKLQINKNMRVGEDIWHAREALRKALPHLESGIFRDPEGADKAAINIRIILSNAEISKTP
jgi:hypothetical protein